jgi:DNA-3-methyladenine glycosylase I
VTDAKIRRCAWASHEEDGPMLRYHDREWGVPSHDDRHLFEMLVLEGAQAGLSWRTILNKRDGYRQAFADFDVELVAAYTGEDVERLLQDPRIVRNRRKVTAAVEAARAVLSVRASYGSLDAYLWSFVGGSPIRKRRRSSGDVPAETAESRAMSRDLKGRGFRFVGPTICYAFMQAAGLVNDHETRCFRHDQV